MTYKILIASFLAVLFLVEPSKALGTKKALYEIADSDLQVIKGDLVTIAPGTKFVLTEDFHLKLEGEIKMKEMEELTVFYHVEKKSMNFIKDGEIDVCEAINENQDNEHANKMSDCMFNLFGISSSCPIKQDESGGSKFCDMSEAKNKFEMAVGKTSFEYELNAGDEDSVTIISGWVDIQKKK